MEQLRTAQDWDRIFSAVKESWTEKPVPPCNENNCEVIEELLVSHPTSALPKLLKTISLSSSSISCDVSVNGISEKEFLFPAIEKIEKEFYDFQDKVNKIIWDTKEMVKERDRKLKEIWQ